MSLRSVSLSELFYMTDEELEQRTQALQDFKSDMCIMDTEEQSVHTKIARQFHVLSCGQKPNYKNALHKNIALRLK